MKIVIPPILLLFPLLLFSQCSISSIEFEAPTACNESNGRYAIPVTVTYQNNVETVELRATGLAYDFGKKRLKNNHHGTSTQNQFTFVIYEYADGLPNDVWIYVDMYGADCTQLVRDSANYTISYSTCPIITDTGGDVTPDVPLCEESLILTGTVTEDTSFYAYFSIQSTQVLEASYTGVIGAPNNVTLKAGFHAKNGSTVTINNTGCEPQDVGNGAGSGIVAGNCPKVLYLSSPVSNTRVYSADSLIITNQNIFPTGNVTYYSPLIEYGTNYNAQSGSTVSYNKVPCSNL